MELASTSRRSEHHEQDESVLADLKLKLEEASAEERQARTRYNAAVDAEKPLQLLIGLQKVWEHLAEEKRQAKAELIQKKQLAPQPHQRQQVVEAVAAVAVPQPDHQQEALEAVADQGWQVVRGKKGREQSGGKPSTLGRNTLTDTAVQKKMRDIVDANGYRGASPDYALLSKTGMLCKVQGPAQPEWMFGLLEEVLGIKFSHLLSSRKQRDVLQGTIAARLNSQAARPLALSQAIARIESEEGIEAKKERLTLATIRSVNKKRYVQHIEKWGEGIPAAAPAGFADFLYKSAGLGTPCAAQVPVLSTSLGLQPVRRGILQEDSLALNTLAVAAGHCLSEHAPAPNQPRGAAMAGGSRFQSPRIESRKRAAALSVDADGIGTEKGKKGAKN